MIAPARNTVQTPSSQTMGVNPVATIVHAVGTSGGGGGGKLELLPRALPLRQFGAARDLIEFISEDFDDPLEDFSEYMPPR